MCPSVEDCQFSKVVAAEGSYTQITVFSILIDTFIKDFSVAYSALGLLATVVITSLSVII